MVNSSRLVVHSYALNGITWSVRDLFTQHISSVQHSAYATVYCYSITIIMYIHSFGQTI